MNTLDVNPYIRHATTYSELIPPFHTKRRIIFDYEIIYVASGKFLLDYNGIDFICNAGDLLLLRPGISHEIFDMNVNVLQPHMHFDIQYNLTSEQVPVNFKDYSALSEYERTLIREDVFAKHSLSPKLKISDIPQFLTLFFEVIQSQKELGYSLPVKIKMLELLNIIEQENFPNAFNVSKINIDIWSDIHRYIESNLDQPITLDNIEKQFNYSKFYISREFKKKYGCSIMNYHKKLRFEYAKNLLHTMSVSEVSEKLGFASVYSFSQAFKNHFGITPSSQSSKQ